MKKNFLNSKLRPNSGCRRELSGVGNNPGAIARGGNCPGVIAWEAIIPGEHVGWAIVQEVFVWGAIIRGQFLFQVVSPSDIFTTFNTIINCSLPVLIYEYF